MKAKNIFLETRPQFLVLSPILVVLGAAISSHAGNFNLSYFLLSMVGLVLLHISVNTLNDYSDYRSGIDLRTTRTPFSGGSGFLPSGALPAKTALILGVGSFLLAVPIGIYMIAVRGIILLPLLVVGAILVLAYTTHITRIGYGAAEFAAGLGLGTLPVLGTFMIINGGFSWSALYASIPSGFLVSNLLLLNEFPDVEADKGGGRKTLPIILGWRGAAIVYSTLTLLTYIWIIIGAVVGLMPFSTWLALLTLPFGVKAIRGALAYRRAEELVPAQGANVITVLLTQLLLGVGYFLAVAART